MALRARYVLILSTLVLLAGFTFAVAAHAQSVADPVNNCAEEGNNFIGTTLTPNHLTNKVVTCIQGTILEAMGQILTHISDFMKPLVSIMMVFAIIVFGMRIMGGEKNIKPKAAGFLLRMALVVMFSYELGGMAYDIFRIFDQMSTLASQSAFIVNYPAGTVARNTPWELLDHYVGVFLGFSAGASIIQGLLGLITGVMYNSTAGILMFITGVMAILNIFFFAVRVVFTYLTSFIIVAFLVIISPIVIPMALFYTGERYFTKWLHILFSAMLTPMIMFAFLAMFINLFGQLIGELFCPLGFILPDLLRINPYPAHCYDLTGWTPGPSAPPPPQIGVIVNQANPIDFRAFFRLNQPLFSWLMPGDPASENELTNVTQASSVGLPSVQSNINPMVRRAMDAGSAGVPGVDFGPNTIQTVQALVFAFIKLWIFGTIMTAMVKRIPAIANDMAGIGMITSIGPTKLEGETKRVLGGFRDRFAQFGTQNKEEFMNMARKEIRPF